jgi:hypothetical protein
MGLADKRRVTKILEVLPAELLERVREFAEEYHPGLPVFRGPQPNMATVNFVRDWLADAGTPVSTNSRASRSMTARRVGR